MLAGAIRKDQVARHMCPNKRCIRHIIAGSQGDNVRDAIKLGRGGNLKLTVAQVEEIRQIYSKGMVTQAQLARQYQVSSGRICLIVNRKERI